jgi:asparagine synthase (glutamine-hydrolysing)
MCGICGKISLNDSKIDPKLLQRMTSFLSHRGPDGDGVYAHHGPRLSVGLGHRRLSIIDLSEDGRQPMPNEDESLWIVFNGEIYNFQSLRSELEQKGHRFRSRTDTEVILHLYEDDGAAGISKLRGMFAFAIWDERSESLLLARDRVGIKPLVYYWDGRTFLFASEIKSILQDPVVRKEIDAEALDLYLTFNYIPAPHTIFKNIRKLRPGHILFYQKGEVREKEYWTLQAARSTSIPASDDFAAQKKSLFSTAEEAVRFHMIADVPIGAFLSGGLDSSIVVGLMSRNSAIPVKTYSIGYKDMPLFDETHYARDVALMNYTDHHEIKLSAQDVIAAIPNVLESFDEPFADSSTIPSFIVSRETARNVKVALSGDGGDELFAGYRMYAGEYWYSIYRYVPRMARRHLIEPLLLSLPDSRDNLTADYARRLKKFLKGSNDSFEERFFLWNEIFSGELRRNLLLHPSTLYANPGKDILFRRLNERDDDVINRMLYADFKESLPGDMLQKVDAMSMLNSLEVRVPLLDHHVCELAFSFSGDVKMKRGRGKHILLETFKHILPPSLHKRPKWGFEIPIGKWMKTDLKYLIDEYLSRDLIQRQGIFNFDMIHQMVRNLMNNRMDTSWQLWNLIVFQYWYFRHIDVHRR